MTDSPKIILGIFITAAIMLIVGLGISRSERAECFRWQEEANEFPCYYITEWQKGQCDAHSIEIDAPIR